MVPFSETESSENEIYLKKREEECSINPKSCKSLLEAAQEGNLEAVKYFVKEKKARVDGTRSLGVINSPLCTAAMKGHLEVVKYLVENKANVNKKCTLNMTALDQAIYTVNFEIVKYLSENGANLKKPDVAGNSPLHTAVTRNSLEIVKYFVEKQKVEINDLNHDRNTPLHLAAEHGSLEIVKYLVEHKADVKLINNKGETALDLAKQYHNTEVAEYLQSVGGQLRRGITSEVREFDASENMQNLNKRTDCSVDFKSCKSFREAVIQGNLKAIKYFIEEKKVEMDGPSPLSADYLESKTGVYRRNMVLENQATKFSRPRYDVQYSKLTSPLITNKEIGFNTETFANEETNTSNTISNGSPQTIGTLFLLDLLIRYFTKEKYATAVEESTSESEVQAHALKITETFEELLKFYGRIPAEQVNLTEVHSNIYQAMKSGRDDRILKILCSCMRTLTSLSYKETEELLSAVMTNNPTITIPEVKPSDGPLYENLPSLVNGTCSNTTKFPSNKQIIMFYSSFGSNQLNVPSTYN